MPSQKNYGLLRFLQWILSALGWLCFIAAPLVLVGLPVLSVATTSDLGAFSIAFFSAIGSAIGLVSLGVTYLLASRMIEVVVDIAANTQRTAYLLDHMIRHWPGTNPAPLTQPMPVVTADDEAVMSGRPKIV